MKKTEKKELKKHPGKFLTVMILFLIVGDIQIPYYLAHPDALSAIYGNLPSWYPLYAVLGLASNVAIIIGMWKFKKWAVYILIAYFISKVPSELFMFQPAQQMATLTTTVVGASLWFWAIKREWKYFN
jgi:hypothetical protein